MTSFPPIGARARRLAALAATFPGVVVLVFAAALISRLWLSRQLDPIWALPVSGVAADLIVAALCACVLVLLAAAHWTAAAAFTVVWGVLMIANTEHIYALDAPLRLDNYRFAFNETFIGGSVLHLISWPAAVAIAVIGAWLIAGLRRRARPSAAVTAAAAVLLAATATTAWRQAAATTDWRAANPLAMMLTRRLPLGGEENVAEFTLAEVDAFFVNETAAAPPPSFGEKPSRPNVLLVVLEGVPGAYLRQVRRATGVRPPIEMPKLSDIAAHGLVVPDYVSGSYGTINGLYALYCGDYAFNRDEVLKPYLLPMLPPEVRVRCLPQRLREAGYHTAFMQGAPLEYMQKSFVLSAMGFSEILGRDNLTAADSDSLWGAEDGALFDNALRKIEEFRKNGEPWLLSLLTVGTHHPFLAPEEYRNRYGDAKTAAVRYLDDVLFDFYNALQERGVTEDTLIIFTSDESHGVPGHPFGSYWGLNVALAPGVAAATASGAFSQGDLPVSVLDYLQLGDAGEDFLGRSFFRRYAQPRHLLFGDFALVGDVIYQCQSQEHCSEYRLRGGRLFAPDYRLAAADNEGRDARVLLSAAAARTAHFYGRRGELRNELVAVENLALAGDSSEVLQRQTVLPARSLVNVLIALENNGDNAVMPYFKVLNLDILDIDSDYAVADKLPRLQMPLMPPKSSFKLNYIYHNLQQKEVGLVFGAFPRGGSLDFNVKTIKVLVTPSENVDETYLEAGDFSLDYAKGGEKAPASGIFYKFHEKEAENGGGTEVLLDGMPMPNGDFLIPRRYRLGERADFSHAGDAEVLYYLAGDWSYPEDWGVWSDGPRPSLVFHLDKIDAAADYEVRFEVLPHIDAEFAPERKVQIVLNDKVLGTLVLAEQKISGRSVVVPGTLLRANELNRLTFAVENVFSPIIYNRGEDFTRLGVALIAFEIKEAS